jgi:acetyltransferase-like isoleucine patch superfamily enzyme
VIDDDVVLGRNVRIFDPALVNLFGCTIGDDSFVGPFVEITRGVVIGRRVVVESHSFICDGVTIEDDVFVGHGAVFVNDMYPRTDRHVVYPKTRVESFASVGSNATILGGIVIGSHAIIGAGAVVTRDVPGLAVAAGNPARVARQFNSVDELKAFIRSRQASTSER